MSNFLDMNDLYNFQDVCLLCKTVENRFEVMHEMYDFLLRCSNSAKGLLENSELCRMDNLIQPSQNKNS